MGCPNWAYALSGCVEDYCVSLHTSHLCGAGAGALATSASGIGLILGLKLLC